MKTVFIHRQGMRSVLIFVLIILVTSCRTSKNAVSPSTSTATKRDTIYQATTKYDSIYVFDGIIPTDSITLSRLLPKESVLSAIYQQKAGLDKDIGLHIEYRYTLLRDTIYVHKIDSIPVVRIVAKKEEIKVVPAYYKYLSALGLLAIILLIVHLIYKYRKILSLVP